MLGMSTTTLNAVRMICLIMVLFLEKLFCMLLGFIVFLVALPRECNRVADFLAHKAIRGGIWHMARGLTYGPCSFVD